MQNTRAFGSSSLAAPIDEQGRASCPHCRSILSDLKEHERLVEDIIPAKVVVTAYHTTSGFCPCCRRRVESRAPEQPPEFGELSRAVVARKISGLRRAQSSRGSRSKKGADAWAKLASLLRTASQRGLDVLGTLKSKLVAAWAGETPATPVQ